VVTGALEHIAERVRHLVYLNAFVPHDGDTVSGRRASPAIIVDIYPHSGAGFCPR